MTDELPEINEVTQGQIREFLDLPARPAHESPKVVVRRVSSIAHATGDSFVYAKDLAALALALTSSAALVLAPAGSEECARVIAVADPRTAFARVYDRWFKASASRGIHESASVHPDAKLGKGVSIGAGCVVEAGVTIGEDSQIGPRVVIHSGTAVGRRVRVQAGAVLGSDGFGYVRLPDGYMPFPQLGTLSIGDDVEIGANTTIDRGALEQTTIGRGTKIDNLVHIAHNCVIGEDVIIAAQVGIAGSTTVEDGAMLGGQVGLGERVTIGKGTVLGGQSGVLSGKDFRGKPGEIYFGTPARPVRQFMREMARLARGR